MSIGALALTPATPPYYTIIVVVLVVVAVAIRCHLLSVALSFCRAIINWILIFPQFYTHSIEIEFLFCQQFDETSLLPAPAAILWNFSHVPDATLSLPPCTPPPPSLSRFSSISTALYLCPIFVSCSVLTRYELNCDSIFDSDTFILRNRST